MNAAGLVGFELAELHLDPRRQGIDEGVAMVVAAGDPGHELRLARDVRLAHVEQHEDGLLGQEAEATDGLLVVSVELDVADRAALHQCGVKPLEDRLLALVGVALGLRPVAPGRAEPLEPALGHRKVGEDELEVKPLDVTPRVDRSFGVGHGRVLEDAHDMEQGVRIAEPGKVLGRQLLRPDAALGRGRRGRQVDVGHVGVDDLLRLEDLGQPVQPRIGHLDDPDVELEPAEAARLGVAAGERVEDGCLAGRGEAHDRDLHGPIVADPRRPALCGRPAQYPAPGSTTFSSGSPAA